MKSALLRFLTPNSESLLKPGEFVVKCEAGQPFTHCLCRDRNMYMTCEADQLSGHLSARQVQLLVAIENYADRIDVFKNKLGWGLSLKAGSNVLVSIPGKDIEAKAVVRYCADAESSNLFGVELMVRKL